MATDPRGTRAWRKLRDQVITEEPLCSLAIDGVCTLVSTTADHIVTFAEAPELAMVRSNLRGACRPCNRARGSLPDSALVRPTRATALGIFD
jgi:5-methylcytosine-specific restriction endonuclease McrA